MAVEIERKFLVRDTSWKDNVSRSIVIKQGYLSTDPDRTVRIRIKGDQGVLTVKGRSQGVSRAEFEYEIPRDDAEAMLLLCNDVPIEKVRHEILVGGKLWELDVFEGANQGLVLAEIELADENEVFELPSWVEKEVSEDVRYYNSYLSKTPYATWK
jgi:adenylate cyclase